jgi:phosphohistidine phosphatase
MSRQLVLMRHAKSDWSRNLRDHDRMLNNRGRQSALNVGRFLQQEKLRPGRIYCSTAERVRQTIQGVLQNLDYPESQVVWDARIYLASLYELLSLLAEWLPHSDSIMMVGHNPGMEELFSYLVPEQQIEINGNPFPTAALACIDLPDDGRYERGCGKLLLHIIPRQLEDKGGGI